jgi:hypothetical protein
VSWLSPDGLVEAWVTEHAGAVVGHACVVRADDPVVASRAGVPTDRLAGFLVSSSLLRHAGRTSGQRYSPRRPRGQTGIVGG